jgi:ATP-binding cassette subfamily C protein
VLNRVSLWIPAGRFVAVSGTSGAGKTTLVDLIVGLHRTTEGTIFVDDVPLSDLDLQSWRTRIGYVPQEMTLFHETIYTNVTYGDPRFSRDDCMEALKKAEAWQFVEKLEHGMDTVVGERGARLSGGQRQRIALARALVSRPTLLILDEVTSGLDPVTEAAICETLGKLSGETTLIAVSHQPAVLRAADMVYQLEQGSVRVLRDGRIDVAGLPVRSDALAASRP